MKRLNNYKFKGTPGEWGVPHLSDDNVKCNCGYVLCETYCGSVATVNHSKEGADWMEGDNPPLEEAKANGYLIGAAPNLLEAAIDFLEKVEDGRARSTDSYNKIKAAVYKALNMK